MRTSAEIDKIAEALAAAQKKFTEIKKDKTVKTVSYSYRYADLSNVIEATRPHLAEHGVFLTQAALVENNRLTLTTRLIHKTGQWLESDVSLKITTDTPQGIGSTMTYARRYGMCAILNVCADEDDDAQSVEPPKAKPEEKRPEVPNQTPKPFSAQDVASSFEKYGITLKHLEQAMQKSISQWDKKDIDDLVGLGVAFKEKKKDPKHFINDLPVMHL